MYWFLLSQVHFGISLVGSSAVLIESSAFWDIAGR